MKEKIKKMLVGIHNSHHIGCIITQDEIDAVEKLFSDYQQSLIEKLKGLKTKPHDNHNDKDEWYACVTCMEETNIDETIDKAIQLIKENG